MTNQQKRLTFSAVCRVLLVAYWIVLFVATHLAPTTSFLPPDKFDKFYHFASYAVLVGLLATAWQLSAGVLTFRHLCWTWALVAVFGALDEITQTPFGRDCSFWDWSADAIGAAAGILMFVWLRKVLAARIIARK